MREYAQNSFEGKLNKDSEYKKVQNNELINSENTTVVNENKYGQRRPIKGTELIGNLWFEEKNVLGAFDVLAEYDYNNTGNYETHESILIFSGTTDIHLYDTITNQIHHIYSNTSESLNFPEGGSIDGSFDRELGVSSFYFEDNKNMLRRLVLKYPNTQTLSDFNVIPFFINSKVDSVSVEEGGFLKGGSYQVSIRLYNKTKCIYSKWSLFTNPIPVNDKECSIEDKDTVLGTPVDNSTTKKIVIEFSFIDSLPAQYDSIQVAYLENTDGQPFNSLVANITAPNEDWFNSGTIELTGSENTYTTGIENIVIDDIAVLSAKSNVISENRLFRANVSLRDLTYNNGDVEISKARTITKTLPRTPYKCPESTHNDKGHFRKEVYAYAITYVDEHGNWSNPQPFDFSDFYKEKETTTVFNFNAKSFVGAFVNQTQLFLTNTSPALIQGDYVKIGTETFQVFEINYGIPSSFKVEGNVTATPGTPIIKLYGQSGNQANNWAWKYPERSDNQFTILDEFNNPTAIGLEIQDIKNHPTWAKGFAILRQKRIKNIVYQSPHIPLVGVLGVPTQGVGELTENNQSGVDYRGQNDTLAPKTFGLGAAKNIYKYKHSFRLMRNGNPFPSDDPYVVFYSQYKTQYADDNSGSQIPLYTSIVPPDYIFNYNNPWYLHDFTGTEKLVIADAVLLKRKNLINEEIERERITKEFRYYPNLSPPIPGFITGRVKREVEFDSRIKGYNSYQALDNNLYFYSRSGRILQFGLNKYFRKLSDIEPLLADNINIEKAEYLELAHPAVTLLDSAFTDEYLKGCLTYGNVEQLARSQFSPQIVGAPNSFNEVYRNNKNILLKIDKRLQDFTLIYASQLSFGFRNLFPEKILQPNPQRVFNDENLFIPNYPNAVDPLKITVSGNSWGKALRFGHIQDDRPSGEMTFSQPPKEESRKITPYYACNDGEVAGGTFIVNVERGLGDNRYNKISNEWIFTGTFVPLSKSDITNNTPKTVQVWGGDCFVTKYTVKVNDNSPRVSDMFESLSKYTKTPGAIDGGVKFDRNTKTGLFEKNVEFLELYIESEVNTAYHEKISEYPAYKGEDESNYSNPYVYKYNPGYSLQNFSKVWASYLDTCKRERNKIPASFIWSDKKIYGALSNEFVDVDGFNRYRASAVHNLDEQHGEITKIITFGMGEVHAIQERRVRYEPVERSIIQGADGQALSITGDLIIGKGGVYLPIQNGSQHIRTVRVNDGFCFFVDNLRQEVVTFGNQGSNFKTISSIGMQSEFLTLLKTKFTESQLSAHLISLPNHSEYVVITPEKSLIWNNNIQGWVCELITPEHIKNMVSSNKNAYWITNKLYKAYVGNQGFIMNQYVPSKITFVCNDAEQVIKVFDTLRINAEGLEKIDDIFITIPQQSNVPAQASFNLTKDRNGERLSFKNFQHTINSIRNQEGAKRMFGRFCIIEITINNNGREVAIDSVETHFTQSPRNR